MCLICVAFSGDRTRHYAILEAVAVPGYFCEAPVEEEEDLDEYTGEQVDAALPKRKGRAKHQQSGETAQPAVVSSLYGKLISHAPAPCEGYDRSYFSGGQRAPPLFT